MASQTHNLHFVMIPLMCPGHLIPMVDMAKLLAQNHIMVTIVTTPLNAARFSSVIDRAIESGLPIQLLQFPFPAVQAGLPAGCESVDEIPSYGQVRNFFTAVKMLQEPVEKAFRVLSPSPSCIISDKNVPWTSETAKKFEIPWIIFDGMNCFTQLCTHNLYTTKIYECALESESFVVPGLPDRIELRRAQLPGLFNPGTINVNDFRKQIRETELGAYGVVVNSFEELEQRYVNEFKKVRGKVWCIGPLSLCNKDNLDKAQRGNKASIDEQHCIRWLDSWPFGSVVYACMGSLARATALQVIELALGLEASGRPFIWVVRGGSEVDEIHNWILREGFEERVKERGLLIKGWSPQVLILSHPSVGAFLTHCGWNSTLEGITVGVPMITWPMFAEQFFNEKLVVEVLKTSVSVGAKVVVHMGEEEKYGVTVRRDQVKEAIDKIMDEREEGRERRKRAKELGEKGMGAMEEGGSSHKNLTLLIQDIMQHVNN
nr:glycosyltransferase [Lonicera macranthoides]